MLALSLSNNLPAFEMSASRPVVVDFAQTSATGASLNIELGDIVRQEVINQGVSYDRFPIEGQPVAGPVGRPELPALVKFVLIPPQSGVSLRVKNLKTHIVRDVNPFPRQPEPLEKDIKDFDVYEASLANAPLVIDENFYKEDRFWPEENVSLGEPQVMRGYRILPVRINPMRYNPVTKELEVMDDVDLEFDFSSDENRTNFVENPGKLRPSDGVNKLLQQMVVNPPSLPDRDFGVRGGSILYILGTGNNWNNVLAELTPLVEWRRKMGWTVETLRVNNPADVNAVRNAIQDFYDEAEVPPEHIVIVGDTDNNFPFGYFNHQAGAAYPYESDHDFAMLEGNDIIPDASVGRLQFYSTNELRDQVLKTIRYESDPFLAEGNAAGWQIRGAVESISSRSGVSSNDMCRWAKRVLIQNGYNNVNELYWVNAGADRDNRQFVYDNINGGVSLFLHRGYAQMGTFAYGDVSQLRNGRMLPFMIVITCNTGDYGEHVYNDISYSERFTREPGGGATIGAVGSAGATHTAYNNIYCGEIIHAIYSTGLRNQGWAHEAGKMALYTHYFERGDIMHEENRNMEAWLTHFYINNLMGDPAVDLFTAVPRVLEVSRPDAIRLGETRVEVTVIHRDDDMAALDATVCLYKQGDFQIVRYPDAEGKVVFDLEPEWTAEEGDSVHLTITGHNLLTSRRSYVIGQPADFIGVAGWEIDDDNDGGSSGNGDGEANQLETIDLAISIANLGENDYQGQMTVNISTDDPNLEVIEDEAVLNQAPAHGESASVNFLVRIGGGFPSGELAPFHVAVSVGENEWFSSAALPVSGPALEFVALDWADAPLHRAENAELSVTLRNVGTTAVQPFRATFFSLKSTIGPVVAEAEFDGIDPDESGESQSNFRVSAHPFHIGSKPVPVGLAIEAANGFIDTVFFDMPISEVREGEPFGPCDYGYICFDDGDVDWFAVPTYNWIEIDPRHDGNGTNTELTDNAEGADRSVVVDLPFTFQYYGQEFDEVTICSNGWIAMGDCHELVGARNRHITGGECPPGMIAPFWEDLVIPQNSGVYYWFDQENNLFIVQWSRLRKLGLAGNNDPVETFQVILHDPRHYPSFTGDGDIIFQYQDITDNQVCNQDWDTPFASVGIASPDLTTGLEYTYWHARPAGADSLSDEMAIKFTTLVSFSTGTLSGRVYDAFDGMPLDSVSIYCTYGFSTMTDENGEFHIEDMLVDSEYEFTAHKRFYNDSTLTGEILEDQDTYIEFGLLHPEFTLSAERSDYIMLTDSIAHGGLTLTNTGNGHLDFTSRYGYRIEGDEEVRSEDEPPSRDDPDETWDLLRRWDIGDSLNNPRVQCVASIKDEWLIGASRIDEGLNIFYRLNRNGELIGQFTQPEGIGGNFGFRDMEYENGNLWAVASDSALYLINPDDGTIVNRWWGINQLRSMRAVTRNPNTGYFYLAATTGTIFVSEMVNDTQLAVIERFEPFDPRSNLSIRKYGLAWFDDDPDGFSLYVIGTNEFPADNNNHPDMAIFKVHPETKEVRFLTDLANHLTTTAGGRCGMTITHTWSNRVFALAVIVEDAVNDWLGVFELAPNSSWISYEPRSGSLEAGEQTEIAMEIASTALDTGMFEIMLDYTHTASPGYMRIPVLMHVVLVLPDNVTDPEELVPNEFRLQAVFPNPFNDRTTIRFTLAAESATRLRIYDLAGREVAALYNEQLKPGRYSASFGSGGLSSGVYICRLESDGKTAVRKMVLMK